MPTNYTLRVIFHMGRSKKNASPWKKIEARAEEILSAGGQIRKLSDERWRVSSQTVSGRSYVVSFGANGSSCECDYNRKRKGARCKHIVAVEMHIMSQKEPAASPAGIVLGRAEIRCPTEKCESESIIGYGLRKHPHRRRGFFRKIHRSSQGYWSHGGRRPADGPSDDHPGQGMRGDGICLMRNPAPAGAKRGNMSSRAWDARSGCSMCETWEWWHGAPCARDAQFLTLCGRIRPRPLQAPGCHLDYDLAVQAMSKDGYGYGRHYDFGSGI